MGSARNGIVQFLENKTIFITGGSGFLAKIFLEKILRIQPNIAKIYVLIRAPDSDSAIHRFQNEVVTKELFRVLKGEYREKFDCLVSEKVVPISGDICYQNLGLKDSNMIETMRQMLDIIINFAATTNFYERYDVAMDTNTWGALHVMNFAKKCVKLKMFLHVSTAYVSCEKEGVIKENPFNMGDTQLIDGNLNLDVDVEKKLVEEKLSELRARKATEESIKSAMKELGIIRARMHGWTNTYVFTKAMGEMLLGKFKDDVPLIILRPTIVTSTFQQPFPGWAEGLRTLDGVIAGYGKGRIKFLPFDPHSIFDMIPGDMVINSMLVAIATQANQSSPNMILHVGSSSSNPIKNSRLPDFFIQYFTKYPLMNGVGKPIKVKRLLALDSMAKFQNYMMMHYILPLKGLQLINILTCKHFNDLCEDYNRLIKSVMRIADLFVPYLFSKGIFDDTNSENLRITAREMGLIGNDGCSDDDDGFNFDPRSIDWEDYFVNTHIPGLVEHVILKGKKSN